ncbi:hypothetical protein HMPREF0645_1052 [Hallella bergensis DSM 17361]|uniref:Uncharacterized protein n=1 Tax=Hallella bergensis DSM 17361 TaxID=585502 RepID=D1PVR7_9BACT|nr:hypothetical protein [Hallella bergensis]EFA44521.1 hypothetical protein HMPREF0645_1052 [Hallella bergensis DSM 17361]
MRNEEMKIEKNTYCQPGIVILKIGSPLLLGTSNTLPVIPGETVTEDEQLSKPASDWWDVDEY